MTRDRFAITRPDGRSNAQVVLDLVRSGQPGQVYSHTEIADALSHAGRRYAERDVRSIVMAAYPRILRECQRALHSIRGTGYRIALASDHNRLAIDRKHRSDRQMLRSFQTLQHVDWSALDPNARKAHEGTLMLVSALYMNQRALERRQDAVERAVRNAGIVIEG